MSRNNQGPRRSNPPQRQAAAPQTENGMTGQNPPEVAAVASEQQPDPAEQHPVLTAPEPRTRRRKKRMPLGQEQLKMAAPERLGFHRHWLNDTPGRLDQKYQDDYDFVLDDEGEKTRQLVGTQESGEPLYAYLMEKPEEWYREDQHAKDEPLRQFDKAMQRGIINGQGPREDSEAFYAPEERISVTTKNTPNFRP